MCPKLKIIATIALGIGALGMVPAVFTVIAELFKNAEWTTGILTLTIASAILFGSSMVTLAIFELGKALTQSKSTTKQPT